MNKKALLEKVLAKMQPKKFKLDSYRVKQYENERIVDIVDYIPDVKDKNKQYVLVHSPKLKAEILAPKKDMTPITEANLNKIKKELTHVSPKNLEKLHGDLKNKSKVKTVVKTILDNKAKPKSKK